MTIKAGMENYEQGKVEEDQKNHKGITVVFPSENHRFELNEMALEELLLQTNVKDRNVVVISVAGVFRKGKSFILDFFLRYMKAKYASKTVSPDDSTWLGPPNEPLKGFPWRGGSDRDTTGMLMWSEIFLATLPNKEEVAIIFLDTQGTFDSESTVKDCATIFALSTMISSIQIYNLSQNIQEDDLQHLQLFTEYGKLALADSGKKPFQKLQFLIRDWSFPYEAEYGEYGGLKILNKRLRISQKQHPELQSIRKHIKSCFSDISCFLMPHPGLKVATNPNFDGRLEDIESDFKECLKNFVPLLLAPEKLLLKQINGHKVKAKELVQYFKTYIAVFSADELPEPKTILIATAEANNLTAVADAKEEYRLKMENVCGGTKPYLNTAVLENEHLNIKSYVLEEFSKKRKMGGEEFSEIYKNNLDSDIEDMYKNFKHHNEAKNIFKAARTPAVFFILAFVHYLLSGIFGFIGLYSLANVANLVMGISIVVLCSWLWIRYSGEMVAVGEQIDEVASVIWENIMKPAYDFCIVKGMQSAVGQSPSFISTPTVDKPKQL